MIFFAKSKFELKNNDLVFEKLKLESLKQSTTTVEHKIV